MKLKILIAVVLMVAPAALFVSCGKKGADNNTANSTQKTVAKQYTCPMHPSYISDKPGECPICGMNLVEMETEGNISAPAVKKKTMYRSTMNPNEVSDKPGKDSMGMEMEKYEVDDIEKPAANVEGLSTINVSPEKQQLLGVTTATAERKDVDRTIRTTGRIAYDPELYYAEQEYISSLLAYKKSKSSYESAISDTSKSMVDSSRFKLKLMGLSDEQIDELKNPDSSLLLTKGDKAWVYASLYEDDIKYVKQGQSVSLSAPSITQDKFNGRVVAIDPVIDPSTRSAKARITADNPNGVLKPDAYLNVEIYIPLGTRLVIPTDAVMNTGTRQIVFVDKGEGVLEPREICTSGQTDDYFIIKSGVTEGEKVVTNANFLIDSESQLKASMQKAVSGMEHKH